MRLSLILLLTLLTSACHTTPSPQPPSPPTASTFLMFQGHAQEAISLYASVFPALRIDQIERYGPAGPGPQGTIKLAHVTLNGHRLMFSDSYVKHPFTFTPSMSLFIDFPSPDALDAAFSKLSHAGQVLMPPDNYGFSPRFAWCTDPFGVSWQLNLPERANPTTRPTR